MVGVPLLEILIAQALGPSEDGITFGLGTRIFGAVGERGIFNDERALGAVEGDELSTIVVEVAAEGDAAFGIIVESFDEIGELTSIFEVEEAARGHGTLRGLIDAGDEVNAGEQVDEEIAAESLAVVGEAAPAEEADGIEVVGRRAADESLPIDGLRAGVRRNGINPGAAGRVAVPIRIDREDLA